MSRRAVGAALCAAAAITLVVAGVTPWWRIQHHGDGNQVHANFTLVGGELCDTAGAVECQSLSYTGRPGLRDDLFGWSGRMALVALVLAAGLAVILAFAGGGRRAALRGLTATTAAVAAALGAAVVALEQLPLSGDTQLGAGLWAALAGAMLAAAAAAWPAGAPGAIPAARRWGLALAVLAVALIAWSTIGLRSWWTGTGTFSSRGMSPLGIELCDRDQCTQLGVGPRRLLVVVMMTAAAAVAAAVVVVSTGLAVRAARGVAPRGWALATAIIGGLAVLLGIGALLVVPRRGAEISPGAWGFLIAGAGLVALAIISQRLLRWIDPIDAVEGPAGPRLVPFGLAPAGPRPVLAALGASAPASPARAQSASAGAPLAPTAALPMVRRAAPTCPTCRTATLWHGKRAAWWCSTCKQTL